MIRNASKKSSGQEFSTIYFNECSQIPYASVLIVLTRLAEKHPDLIQKAFYDLNPVGTRHYTSMLFARGIDPITHIPILDTEQRQYAYINPKDNAYHLSQEFLDSLLAMPERQRKRFYEGVYQAEIDGALWTFETIEHARCELEDVPRDLARVVVAIDPSGTRGDQDERSDNVGIVVAGKSIDGTGYVLADRTCNLPPEGWARAAVNAYREFNADRIVAEQNFGGDMVRAVLHTVDANVPVHLINASRGKAVRAEPVSALYGFERDGTWQKDQIRHAGAFRELEDQMLNFSTAGYLGDRSPDRVDALVWALTDLFVTPMAGEGIYELYRQRAAKLAAEKAQREQRPTPAPQPGSVEWFEMMKNRQAPKTGQ
jgi:terminase large subunit-like protein